MLACELNLDHRRRQDKDWQFTIPKWFHENETNPSLR